MSNRLIMIATVATALVAGSVSSQGATLIGGEGNDTITGTADKDTIDARGGNDTVTGAGDDDNITAGWGDDTVDGGDGNDTIVGGVGNDVLRGGKGNDTIDDIGVSIIYAGSGDDQIIHFPGENPDYYLDGLQVYGDDGNDFISIHTFSVIDGGPGDDYVATSDLPYVPQRLAGGSGYDTLQVNWQLCAYDHNSPNWSNCGNWSVISGF